MIPVDSAENFRALVEVLRRANISKQLVQNVQNPIKIQD